MMGGKGTAEAICPQSSRATELPGHGKAHRGLRLDLHLDGDANAVHKGRTSKSQPLDGKAEDLKDFMMPEG